jgi:glutathione S-transferase
MQLYIGNKNYSSWSMRPWVLMTQAGIDFEEVALRMDFDADSAFKRTLAAVSPVGRVPVLVDDGFAVWESLAICEYLAERFPDKRLWPADARQRARARSLCAEMHAGFGALRSHLVMNIEASLPEVGARVTAERPEVRADLARLEAMWTQALDASGGPMLFGEFGIADAFYAPVCSRLRTYAVPLPSALAAYVERVWALPGVRAWVTAALLENDFLPFDEPYREAPRR